MFRTSHIAAENSGRFSDVTCTVSHAEKDLIVNHQGSNSIEVSFSLDSQLKTVTNDGKYSLGASVAIYFVDNAWKIIGDVGYSQKNDGWEEYIASEAVVNTFDELRDSLPDFVTDLLSNFERLVEHHFANQE